MMTTMLLRQLSSHALNNCCNKLGTRRPLPISQKLRSCMWVHQRCVGLLDFLSSALLNNMKLGSATKRPFQFNGGD